MRCASFTWKQFADRYPAQLSGGQRQRVALARAVVIRPDVLLLDEPLAALDLKLREELQIEIKRVQSALKITTLFVTHDQGEALSMSDRVAVMRDGRIIQIDSPEALYERPNSRYVANFVGRTNLIDVVVREQLANGLFRVEKSGGAKAVFAASASAHFDAKVGDRCLLGARPEHFHLGGGRANSMDARVRGVTYLGSHPLRRRRGRGRRELHGADAAGRSGARPGRSRHHYLAAGGLLPAQGVTEAARAAWL